MRIQEVICRAISGQIHWFQAAEILGVSVRTMRRWKEYYQKKGYDGLFDRRRRRPSPKRVPYAQVEAVLRLYRERYSDFHVKHFHEKLTEEHGITLSYTWVKTALQEAGLITRRARRGPHRKRRPRRPMEGMLLHLDGSTHPWLTLCPDQRDDLLVLMDDATSRVYEARLVEEEDTRSSMTVLRDCVKRHGLFCALYTDRGSHFALTPQQGGPVDRSRPTQIGRALKELHIESIFAYSPQARGRSERLFGTWQGRLPQELRLRGIRDREAANAFLRKTFIPWHNRHFAVAPEQPGSAFTPLVDKTLLDRVFCLEHTRLVDNDNTVRFERRVLQLAPASFRFSFARCQVTVREHLNGAISIWYGPRRIGRYDGTATAAKGATREKTRQVA
jgi:transposase